MFRRTLRVPTLAFALLVGLHPVAEAFGSTADPEGTVQATPPTAPAQSSDGITGTDPEPIEPGILDIIHMLLRLS
jgi:hypothetical protein